MAKEKIYVHDCDDKLIMVNVGMLPSGGNITVNGIATEAGILLSEAFIEPHFFAGYSGGRKSLFAGCCHRKSVMYNHNAEFNSSEVPMPEPVFLEVM